MNHHAESFTNSESTGEDDVRLRGTMLGRLMGGSAVSLVGFGLNAAQAVLQVPLLLTVWTADTFAAWVTVVAMHAFLISCDVGFHSFVGVEVSMLGLRREVEIRGMFGSVLRVWAVLSVLQLGALSAVWVAPNMLPFFSGDTIKLLLAGRAAFAVLVLQWILAGSALSALCRVLLAGGETVLYQWFGVIHRLMLFAATVAAAWSGLGMTGVAIVYSLAATLSAFICVTYILCSYPVVRPRWSEGSWASARELLRRSTGLTVASMLEQSAVGGLTMVVAGWFHELQTAAFATMRALTNFVTQAAGVILYPTVPEFGRTATREGIHKVGMMIESALILGTTSLAVIISIATPWLRYFYGEWTRHELPFDAVLLVGLVAAVLGRQIGLPFQCFFHGTNRVHTQFLSTVIRTVVLYGSLPFTVGLLGLSGVGVSMAVAELSSAAYLVVVMEHVFEEYGRLLQRRAPILGFAQAVVAVGCLCGVFLTGLAPFVCVGVAAIVHLSLFLLQLRSLPPLLVSRVVTQMMLSIQRLRRAINCA